MTNLNEYYESATKRNIGIVSRDEQSRLRDARVAIVGMGGGGGLALTTLVRMGIGHFNIADFDQFSVVNTNRQAGAMQSTVGRPKVEVMAAMAKDIQPAVEVRQFPTGLGQHSVDDFLQGVNLVVDSLDIFAQPARKLLYAEARRRGIPVLFSAPPGFSATLSVFMPDSMSFEDYFDIREGMTPFQIMAAFIVGIAPAGTHWSYTDMTRVEPGAQAAPSSAAALTLMTGVLATEALVILLGRRPPLATPRYAQFDAYKGVYKKGQLRWGNRGPLQRLKRWLIERKFQAQAAEYNRAGFEPLPTGEVGQTKAALPPEPRPESPGSAVHDGQLVG